MHLFFRLLCLLGVGLSSDEQHEQPSEQSGEDEQGRKDLIAQPKKRKAAPLRYEPNDNKRHNIMLQQIHATQRATKQMRARCGCSVLTVIITPENDIYFNGTLDVCGILDSSLTGFEDLMLGYVQSGRGAVRLLEASGQLEKLSFRDLHSQTRATLLDLGMDMAVPKRQKLYPYESSDASSFSQAHPWFPASLPYKPPAELSLSEQQELFRALGEHLTAPGYKAAVEGSNKWLSYIEAVKAKATISNHCGAAVTAGNRIEGARTAAAAADPGTSTQKAQAAAAAATAAQEGLEPGDTADHLLPPKLASHKQILHCLKGRNFRTGRTQGVVKIYGVDVQLHSLYNTVKARGGFKAVSNLRDSQALREWLQGELKIKSSKLTDAKKLALKQYSKYLGPIDPDWDGDKQQQQQQQQKLGSGECGVPRTSSRPSQPTGAAAAGGAVARNSPPACFAVFSWKQNSCARDSTILALAAAELHGAGPFEGVAGQIITRLASGIRVAEAATGGTYRLGSSFATERESLQEQFKNLSGQLYPRTQGGTSHGTCDGCGPEQPWQPECYMEMASVLEMLTFDSVRWTDALSLSYQLTPACGCQSRQHTVVPLLVSHHFLAEHARPDGSLDITAMLPAAVSACGGFRTSAGCNICGASGADWSLQLSGLLPEVLPVLLGKRTERAPQGTDGGAYGGIPVARRDGLRECCMDGNDSSDAEWDGQAPELSVITKVSLSSSLELDTASYTLVGIILHGGGHFTTYVKVPQQLPMPAGWYYYDDMFVGGAAQYIGVGLDAVLQHLKAVGKLHLLIYAKQNSHAGVDGTRGTVAAESKQEEANQQQQQQQGVQVAAAAAGASEDAAEESSDSQPLMLLCEAAAADRSFEAGMPLKNPKHRGGVKDTGGKGQQGKGKGKRKGQEQQGTQEQEKIGQVQQGTHEQGKIGQVQQPEQAGRAARPARAASRGVAAAVQAAGEGLK